MKTKNQKDTKERYEEIVKLVKEAKKEAEKFIKANQHVDPQLRTTYL
jgi:hypothetical protein